jgi:hypothetical protein
MKMILSEDRESLLAYSPTDKINITRNQSEQRSVGSLCFTKSHAASIKYYCIEGYNNLIALC